MCKELYAVGERTQEQERDAEYPAEKAALQALNKQGTVARCIPEAGREESRQPEDCLVPAQQWDLVSLSQPSSGTLCSHSPAVDLGLDGLWTSAAGFSSSGKGTGGIQSDKQNEMRRAK